MSQVAERHETYLVAYDQFAKAQGPTSPAWLQERRARASKQFAAGGFPTTRDEDWRFTNVAPIAEATARATSSAKRLRLATLPP